MMMMRTTLGLLVPPFWLLIVLFAGCNKQVLASGDHPWCYEEEKCGPSHWSGVCKSGHSQSPIDLNPSTVIPAKHLSKILINQQYLEAYPEFWIKNNGHTVQVQLKEEMTSGLQIESDGFRGRSYQFSQMHFHWGNEDNLGSEHTVAGSSYPMELHLVHFANNYDTILAALTDQNSRALAVFGIFFQISKNDNPELNPIIEALGIVESYHPDATRVNTSPLNVSSFFPDVLDVFRYEGSLTTPSCAEKVVWTVFKNPVPISRKQMDAFRRIKDNADKIMVNNFRPTQPLSRRKVLTGLLELSMFSNEATSGTDLPNHESSAGHTDSYNPESGENEITEITKAHSNVHADDSEDHKNHTSSEVEHRSKSKAYRFSGSYTVPIFILTCFMRYLYLN